MRLDQAVVDWGLVASRSKAQTLIKSGSVAVAGAVVTKPSWVVSPNDLVELLTDSVDVGRGATKLRHAHEHFGIDVAGKIVVDVGASTGGFTQVCLDHGANRVVAIDVGHGQLDASLVSHPKVINREGVNILGVTPQWWSSEGLPDQVDTVVADLSFISLQSVIPHVVSLYPDAELVLLVKPQFEVGRGKTRGGIVRDERWRQEALQRVVAVCRDVGFAQVEVTPSPIAGKKGNVEYLLYASRHEPAR